MSSNIKGESTQNISPHPEKNQQFDTQEQLQQRTFWRGNSGGSQTYIQVNFQEGSMAEGQDQRVHSEDEKVKPTDMCDSLGCEQEDQGLSLGRVTYQSKKGDRKQKWTE